MRSNKSNDDNNVQAELALRSPQGDLSGIALAKPEAGMPAPQTTACGQDALATNDRPGRRTQCMLPVDGNPLNPALQVNDAMCGVRRDCATGAGGGGRPALGALVAGRRPPERSRFSAKKL